MISKDPGSTPGINEILVNIEQLIAANDDLASFNLYSDQHQYVSIIRDHFATIISNHKERLVTRLTWEFLAQHLLAEQSIATLPLELIMAWYDYIQNFRQQLPTLLQINADRLKVILDNFNQKKLPVAMSSEMELIACANLIDAIKNKKISVKVANFLLVSARNWINEYIRSDFMKANDCIKAILKHLDLKLKSDDHFSQRDRILKWISSLCINIISKPKSFANKCFELMIALQPVLAEMLYQDYASDDLSQQLQVAIEVGFSAVGTSFIVKRAKLDSASAREACLSYLQLNLDKTNNAMASSNLLSAWIQSAIEKNRVHHQVFSELLHEMIVFGCQQRNSEILDAIASFFSNQFFVIYNSLAETDLNAIFSTLYYYQSRQEVFSQEDNQSIDRLLTANIHAKLLAVQKLTPITLRGLAFKSLLTFSGLANEKQLAVQQQYSLAVKKNSLAFLLLNNNISLAERQIMMDQKIMLLWNSLAELADAQIRLNALNAAYASLQDKTVKRNGLSSSPVAENIVNEKTVNDIIVYLKIIAANQNTDLPHLRKQIRNVFDVVKRHNESPICNDSLILSLLNSLALLTNRIKGPEYIITNMRLADFYAARVAKRAATDSVMVLFAPESELCQAVNLYNCLLHYIASVDNLYGEDYNIISQRLHYLYYLATANILQKTDESLFFRGIERLSTDIITQCRIDYSHAAATLKMIIHNIEVVLSNLECCGLYYFKNELREKYLKMFSHQISRTNSEIDNLKVCKYDDKSQDQIDLNIKGLEGLNNILSTSLLSWSNPGCFSVSSASIIKPWLSYRFKLQSARQKLYDNFSADSQREFCETIRALIVEILSNAYNYVYLAPTICVSLLGSYSRSDALAQSDMELMILLPESPVANLQARYELEFVLPSLTRDILWTGEFRPKGFCIDNNPLFCSELCNTPRGMVGAIINSRQKNADGNYPNDFLYYSMLSPVYVFGNNKLFKEFQFDLQQRLNTVLPDQTLSIRKNWSQYRMSVHQKDHCWHYKNHLPLGKAKKFNIKSCYIQPLTFIALDFALYYGITPKHPVHIMEYLHLKGIIGTELFSQYQKAYEYLQLIRLKLHKKYNRQEDEYTPSNDHDISIRWELLKDVNDSLLLPYFEIVNNHSKANSLSPKRVLQELNKLYQKNASNNRYLAKAGILFAKLPFVVSEEKNEISNYPSRHFTF